jgi:hypothetical protein
MPAGWPKGKPKPREQQEREMRTRRLKATLTEAQQRRFDVLRHQGATVDEAFAAVTGWRP